MMGSCKVTQTVSQTSVWRKSSRGASAKVTAVPQGVPLKMFRKRCNFVAVLHLVQTQPKAKPSHLPEEPYFGHLYPQTCPFILCSKLMTEHDVDEVGWPVNGKIYLAAQPLLHHKCLIRCLQYKQRRTNRMSVVYATLPPLNEPLPEQLYICGLGQQNQPHIPTEFPIFPQETLS